MSKLFGLIVSLLLITAIAGVLLLVGIVFTTVMFQSEQYPDDLGRTWQDSLLIVSVFVLYAASVFKIIIEFFRGK